MPKRPTFETKAAARAHVWHRLAAEHLARFPYPPEGRIPNFAGAADAARRLLDHRIFAGARRIKVNPDAPQRPLRHLALERGLVVYLPTPRLRGGFLRLDPARIPEGERRRAASLSHARDYAEAVDLDELPDLDLIVCGSVAVTEDGRRCGKGEGYSDLEYAILRSLGHPPVPVVTTVHAVQLVGGFPTEATDLPLSVVVTPERTYEVADPPAAPSGIDWDRLDDADLEAMPVLADLARRLTSGR